MVQVYHSYRYDIPEIKPREFGLTGLLAISFAFLLIQLNLALRLPIVATNIPLFAEQMHGANAFADSAASTLASIGSLFLEGSFGARIGFALLNLITAMTAARIAAILYPKSLAPALTLVWLNTSLIFGLASFLERSETITAFFVTFGALSLCRLIEQRHPAWWLFLMGSFLAAIAFNHNLIALAPVLAIAPLLFKSLRAWFLQSGYWATLLALIAAITLILTNTGLPAGIGGTSVSVISTSLLPRDTLLAAIFISPAIAIGISVGLKDAWFGSRDTLVSRVLILLTLPLMALCLLNGAELTHLFPVFPVIAAIAPGALLLSKRFLSKWLIEVITPLAFGTYLFMMGLLILPGSELTSRLPVLDQIFGWDTVATQLETHADRFHSVWIATNTGAQTRALSAHLPEKTVFPVNSNAPPPEFCHKGGLFISEAQNPNPVMLHFKTYQRIGSIMRRVENRPIATFEVFHVVGPNGQNRCDVTQ